MSLGSRVMIFAIAAVALDLLVGYAALISFGHAAYIGLGAYAVGILAAYGLTDALVSLPVALSVCAVYAFLTGLVCLRTKGVYFIMITLPSGKWRSLRRARSPPSAATMGSPSPRATRSRASQS